MHHYLLKNAQQADCYLEFDLYQRAFEKQDLALLRRLRHQAQDPQPLADVWEAGSARWVMRDRSSTQRPDLAVWGTFLLLNSHAEQLVRAQLAADVEFLPLKVDGESATLARVLSFWREDPSQTQVCPRTGELTRLVFDPQDARGQWVFKSQMEGCLHLYATQALKDLCQSEGLQGLAFDPHCLNFFIT